MEIEDIRKIQSEIKGKIFFDYSVKNLNWFNIGGLTKVFFKPESLNELIKFLRIYNRRGKIFILGAGSNILFSDDTFNGVIIKLGKRFNNISLLDEVKVIAGGNVLDRNLSEFCMENEISGMEFLSCIPGSIGGGIRMNSGCYRREFKDILLSIQAIDFDGNIINISSNEIDFKYRDTNIPNDLIFLSATFIGTKKNKKLINEKIIKLKNEKEQTQPSRVKTGGSTFKNPTNKTKRKVWELIKETVPENIKFGDAEISKHHSNFFVNTKNAKSKDMIKLINFTKKEVRKKFNIQLDLEVVLVD
ncbi:MAG: UDP-N-acetylmuramate dehydrogenase [Rickettsiales bacterium TMED289]|nr:MAG: UDP-N-acetylmuramate dehydrogenase [Rickettsiales bacterium TMED289]